MFEKIKSSTGLKLFLMKLLVYLLLIVSFVMSGKGWSTFESSRTRRDVMKGITDILNQMQNFSQSEWEELNDQLADYDIDVTGEELIEKEYDALTILEDAEVSPKEVMIFATRGAWLTDHASALFNVEGNAEIKKAISKLKIYSIVIQIIYYVTILAFIGSIVAMVRCDGIGTYCYSVMIIIQFILFVVFQSRTGTVLNSALSMLGINVSGNNLSMCFCTPAYAALVSAIAASIIWSVILIASKKEKTKIPGVMMLAKNIVNSTSDIKMVSKSKVCSCGSKLGLNDKFCPVCGKKVVENVPFKCERCGAVLEPDSLFCPECGAKAVRGIKVAEPVVYTCRFCGKELEKGSLFCSSCGGKQTEEDEI